MADLLDLKAAGKPERMQRTVLDIAERAVTGKQLSYVDAAIGAMYAVLNIHELNGSNPFTAIAIMRSQLDIMQKHLEAERRAPLL